MQPVHGIQFQIEQAARIEELFPCIEPREQKPLNGHKYHHWDPNFFIKARALMKTEYIFNNVFFLDKTQIIWYWAGFYHNAPTPGEIEQEAKPPLFPGERYNILSILFINYI